MFGGALGAGSAATGACLGLRLPVCEGVDSLVLLSLLDFPHVLRVIVIRRHERLARRVFRALNQPRLAAGRIASARAQLGALLSKQGTHQSPFPRRSRRGMGPDKSTTVDGDSARRPASTTKSTAEPSSSRMRAGSASHCDPGSLSGRCTRTEVQSSGRDSACKMASHTGSAGRRTPTVRRSLHTAAPRLSRMHALGSCLLAGRMSVY